MQGTGASTETWVILLFVCSLTQDSSTQESPVNRVCQTAYLDQLLAVGSFFRLEGLGLYTLDLMIARD